MRSCQGTRWSGVVVHEWRRMWTEVAALEMAAASNRRWPVATPGCAQLRLHGSNRLTIPSRPRPSPAQRRRVIRSPSTSQAIGTAHRLAVHTSTELRPGGTNWSAVNTIRYTSARRSPATENTTGRSARGGGRRRPVAAVRTNTASVPPDRRRAVIHSGEMDSSPMLRMGQLTPRISTTTASNG